MPDSARARSSSSASPSASAQWRRCARSSRSAWTLSTPSTSRHWRSETPPPAGTSRACEGPGLPRPIRRHTPIGSLECGRETAPFELRVVERRIAEHEEVDLQHGGLVNRVERGALCYGSPHGCLFDVELGAESCDESGHVCAPQDDRDVDVHGRTGSPSIELARDPPRTALSNPVFPGPTRRRGSSRRGRGAARRVAARFRVRSPWGGAPESRRAPAPRPRA